MIGKQLQCGGCGQRGSSSGPEVVDDGEANLVRRQRMLRHDGLRWRGMGKGVRWRRGLIQGAIDIVRGGRLSQVPLRDGVAVCILVEDRRVISRKCFRLRRRICRPSKISDRMPH